MDEMGELLALRDAMFEEFGEETVREIADSVDFVVDIVPDMLDDESTTEMFAEMVNFVVTSFSEISTEKVKAVLLSAGIEEEVADEFIHDMTSEDD